MMIIIITVIFVLAPKPSQSCSSYQLVLVVKALNSSCNMMKESFCIIR